MKQTYNLHIGSATAEKIKIKIGSAIPLEKELELEVKGKDISGCIPRRQIVTSEEVRGALYGCFKNIGDALKDIMNQENIGILMSQDSGALQQQVALLEEIQLQTGMTFENGAREALDYLESIDLVAEAMGRIRENTEDLYSRWFELVNSDEAILSRDRANEINALTDEGNKLLLARIHAEEDRQKQLEESLNAEKNSLNELLNETVSSINMLSGAMSSLNSVIISLRGSAIGAEYTMDEYYKSMSLTMSLSDLSDYDAFVESLRETMGGVKILSNSNLFTSAADQKFAQLVAANQFENFEEGMQTEIDYLRQIEINTREQIDAILLLISRMGQDIDELKNPSLGSSNALVQSIYDKYDLNQYQSDNTGYAYWEQQLASGNISAGGLDSAIKEAADNILSGGGSSAPAVVVAPVVVPSGDRTQEQIVSDFDKMMGYSNGGFTGLSGGLVHQQEYVLNAETSSQMGLNNSSSTGVFGEIVMELKAQNALLREQLNISSDTRDNTDRLVYAS